MKSFNLSDILNSWCPLIIFIDAVNLFNITLTVKCLCVIPPALLPAACFLRPQGFNHKKALFSQYSPAGQAF